VVASFVYTLGDVLFTSACFLVGKEQLELFMNISEEMKVTTINLIVRKGSDSIDVR